MFKQRKLSLNRLEDTRSMGKWFNTDVVILAAGQAQRMQGQNKLLQRFDDEIQLCKIYAHFKDQVNEIWINSHRDQDIYQRLIPDLRCFSDDEAGFLGPLMGLKSACSHSQAEYILCVPCDMTTLPDNVLHDLHQALIEHADAEVSYISINGDHIYPFCLLKRSAQSQIEACIAAQTLSLRACFRSLNPRIVSYQCPTQFHSINSEQELALYQAQQAQLQSAQILKNH